MQDAYMIAINATHSVVWNTSCTPDYGDCGCDNCVGEFEDMSQRMDQFGDRLEALGWERTEAVWTVLQAFGGSSFWSKMPTGQEWTIQSLLAVVHGALGLFYLVHHSSPIPDSRGLPGIVSWNDPTSSDIKAAAAAIGQQLLPDLTSYALNPHVVFTTYVWQRIHFGMWKVEYRTLVVGVNLDPQTREVSLEQLPGLEINEKLEVVYDGGASFKSGSLVLEGLGSVGFVSECHL